jgi:hypothetical protein
MPRVVSSQVVAVIDKLFPLAAGATEQNNFLISREHSRSLAGILEVLKQLPQEMVTVDPEQFAEFICSMAAIESLMDDWRTRDFNFAYVQGFRKINPIALIRQTLAKCPDEFPLADTSDLPFIQDAPNPTDAHCILAIGVERIKNAPGHQGVVSFGAHREVGMRKVFLLVLWCGPGAERRAGRR